MSKFFAYDFGQMDARFRWEYDRIFYERWCRESVSALMTHANRTTNPQEADFFVVTPSLRSVPFAAVDQLKPLIDGQGLQFRCLGKPHVYFDFSDSPYPLFKGPNAIVCKSAFHERYYEPDIGVPIPQFPRYRFNRPIQRASERCNVAGFKGNLRAEHGDLRQRILKLNDDRRFIFKSGTIGPHDIQFSESGEPLEITSPGEWSHVEILFNSAFAILPRANGYALSYRMIECMNAGCVPVIISDGYVLPLREILDYSQFSIRIAEADVERLPQILASRLLDVDELQRRCRAVYSSFFATTKLIIDRALEQVCQRIQNRKPSLTEIANRHECDKGTAVGLAGPPHGYTEIYESLLSGFANRPVKLLEIGVYRGASLRTWYDYFPNAQIYAMDCQPSGEFANDRTKIFQGNQESRSDLRELAQESEGDFDFIIDDGGHRMSQQQVSLGYLFAFLKPGGLYFIEDLHTSLDPGFGAEPNGDNNTLSILENFRRTGKFDSPYMTAIEIDYLNDMVEHVSLHCGNRLAVIRKKRTPVETIRSSLVRIGKRVRQTLTTVSETQLDKDMPNATSSLEKDPLVSIIVAVHDVADYIATSLDSCLNQHYSNFEIVLVDDCSSDSTSKICQQYARDHSQIRLIRNDENTGVYVSRNRGFQAARGDYLCWHDGDDLMQPNRLRVQMRAIYQKPGALGSVARMRRMERVNEEIVFHAPVANSYCSTLFFHRSVLEQIGYFDSVRFMGDREYFDRFVKSFGLHRLVLADVVVWDAWKRPNSLTTDVETGEGSWARTEYFHLFRHWHQTEKSLFIPFPQVDRPFPVPKILLP